MTSTIGPWPRWTRLPGWLLRDPRLELLTIGTFALASLTGLVLLVTQGAAAINYLALAVTVAGLGLASRRRWTGIALAAAGPLLSTLASSRDAPGGVASETLLIWSLVVFGSFYWALKGTSALPLGLASGLTAAAAFGVESPLGVRDPLVVAALATAIAAAAIGSAVSSQRRLLAEAEGRRQDARLTREAEIERRIAQERVRIARDLHDVVGHQVAVVSMHLGAAEVHLAGDRDATARDLAAARVGVQAVLRETQRILDILRLAPGEDGVVPSAGHAQLEALVDTFRRAGHPVTTELDELPADLAADVGAAVYRTIQEAMTNATKHGSGATTIHLHVEDPLVRLRVTNPVGQGRSAVVEAAGRGGYGLVGMRERVVTAGGTLTTSSHRGTYTLDVTLRLDGGRVA